MVSGLAEEMGSGSIGGRIESFPTSIRELVAGEMGLVSIISLHTSFDDKIRCFLSQLGRSHYE
jgi:hypothetical protein